MKINKLSPSSYQKYTFCQWSWYISYILSIKDKAGKAAFLGSLFHDSMEKVTDLAIEKKYDKVKPEDIYEENLEKLKIKEPEAFDKCKPADLKDIRNKFLTYLINSTYSPMNKDRNIILSEQEFMIEMPGEKWKCKDGTQFKINGRIDRVDNLDVNIYEVIDYKTGQRKDFNPAKMSSEKKTIHDLYHDIQLLTYLHYGYKTFGKENKDPVIIATLDFIKDGGPYSVAFDQLDRTRGLHMMHHRFKTIEENDKPVRNRGWHCKHLCYYGSKTGICDKTHDDYVNYGLEFVELTHKNLEPKAK